MRSLWRGRAGTTFSGSTAQGAFGVGRPHPRVALELLFSNRGLLVLSPVLALAGVGTVLLYRRGWRAEALTIGGIALAFLAYDSGYVNPFGGDVPGPRFLIPAIPFLGVALAPCYRRLPGPTLALAVASGVLMVVATGAQPLLPSDDTGLWWRRLMSGDLSHTVLTWLGSGHGWASLSPFLLAVVVAAALAAWSTTWPSFGVGDVGYGLAALACWLCLAAVAPIAVVPGHPVALGGVPLLLVAAGIAAAAVVSVALVSTGSRA